MSGYARRAKNTDPLYKLKVSQSESRCQATYGEWGDPEARRCGKKIDGIFIDEMSRYVALCRECRIMALGYTAVEKRGVREKSKAAQMTLLMNMETKKKDYGVG